MFPPVLRQGAEEEINRQAQSAWRRRFEQVQDPVEFRLFTFRIEIVRPFSYPLPAPTISINPGAISFKAGMKSTSVIRR